MRAKPSMALSGPRRSWETEYEKAANSLLAASSSRVRRRSAASSRLALGDVVVDHRDGSGPAVAVELEGPARFDDDVAAIAPGVDQLPLPVPVAEHLGLDLEPGLGESGLQQGMAELAAGLLARPSIALPLRRGRST